jgi:hypothetical protein
MDPINRMPEWASWIMLTLCRFVRLRYLPAKVAGESGTMVFLSRSHSDEGAAPPYLLATRNAGV